MSGTAKAAALELGAVLELAAASVVGSGSSLGVRHASAAGGTAKAAALHLGAVLELAAASVVGSGSSLGVRDASAAGGMGSGASVAEGTGSLRRSEPFGTGSSGRGGHLAFGKSLLRGGADGERARERDRPDIEAPKRARPAARQVKAHSEPTVADDWITIPAQTTNLWALLCHTRCCH